MLPERMKTSELAPVPCVSTTPSPALQLVHFYQLGSSLLLFFFDVVLASVECIQPRKGDAVGKVRESPLEAFHARR